MKWKRVLAWCLMLGVFSGQAAASKELLKAAGEYEIEPVERLLAAGADVNYQDENGDTALIRAAQCFMCLSTVEPLLEAGADVHLQDEFGDTALLAAAYGDNFAMAGGYVEPVDWLLAAGADINHQNKAGHTALQIAVGSGYGDTLLVGRLLAAGADVNH